MHIFFALTSTFALNKAFHPSTLASNLLAIVASLFDYGYNIFDLVIGLSIDVLLDVVGGIDDDHVISFDLWLGVQLGEE
jgi:hypothetical protein